MRAGPWLACSFAVNVALAVALIFALKRLGSPTPHETSESRPVVVFRTSSPVRIAKTNVLIRPRLLNWSDIESADYAAFITNLKAIGCPNPTIRDIIVADLNQVYGRRLQELSQTNDFEWWRTGPGGELTEASQAAVDAVENERQELLRKLLGPNWDADLQALQPATHPLGGPVLAALAPATRQQIQTLAAELEKRLGSLVKTARDAGRAVDPAELVRVRDEYRARLAQLMTPAQFEEFALRYSAPATRLREELAGVEPGPEEFRAVYRAVEGIDRELDQLEGRTTAADVARRVLLQRQREGAIATALGPARADELSAARDPDYAEARRLAQQTGLPLNTALAFSEMRSLLNEQQEQILADDKLTPEQRLAAWLRLNQDVELAREQVLGVKPAEERKVERGPPPLATRFHTLVLGETLISISFRYGVSVPSIMILNPEIDWSRVPPGTTIRIPERPNLPPPPWPTQR